jgi:hypothetical protein
MSRAADFFSLSARLLLAVSIEASQVGRFDVAIAGVTRLDFGRARVSGSPQFEFHSLVSKGANGATPSLPRVPAKVSSPASQRPFALGRRTADLLEPATGDGVPVGGPAGRGVIASNIDKQLAEIIRLDFLNNPPPAPTGAL